MKLDKHLPLTETTYYILLSLFEPAHGYIMMKKVEALSNGRVKIDEGTMYGAIENLLKQEIIKSVESTDKRRKRYIKMKKVEARRHGTVTINAGTIYGVIEYIHKQKLINSVESTDKRQKTYMTAEKGVEFVKLDYARRKHMPEVTDKLLSMHDGD